MNLAELLSPKRVIANMEASEHWPAIEELVDHLINSGDLPASKRTPVLKAFRDREDQCSTGIGAGIAIPHAFMDDIDEVIAVFGSAHRDTQIPTLRHRLRGIDEEVPEGFARLCRIELHSRLIDLERGRIKRRACDVRARENSSRINADEY